MFVAIPTAIPSAPLTKRLGNFEGKTEGYYVHVKFAADATVPAEIDRQMKINDAIVRQMITRI